MDYIWENKLFILVTVVLMITIHNIIVKPLKVLLYYKNQGVSRWRFFPICGPVIIDILRDSKKFGDVIYSQKMIHHLNKSQIISSEVSNIMSNASIVLYDPALIQDFFMNKNSYYNRSKMAETLFKTIFGEGIIFSDGEVWKRARRITSKLLTFEFLNSYIPMITTIVEKELDKINLAENVELITTLESITGNISLSIFFGRTIEDQFIEGVAIDQYLKELVDRNSKVILSPLFLLSGGKILPREYVRRANLVRNAFKRLVREELEKLDASKTSLVRLYAKEENYIGGQPPESLVVDITNQILNFYIAGRDTTSYLVLMALYYYTQYPLVADRVKTELSPLFSQTSLIWNDLKSIPYFEAFIKETLRIYGPAIGIQPREAIKTHTIGNITILKGTTVSVGMAANSLNPKYFSDPLMFNPDRWVDGSILDEQFAFIPFSAGPRNCIGQHLSAIMTKIIMMKILARYNISLENGYQLQFVVTSTYGPKAPLRFVMSKIEK